MPNPPIEPIVKDVVQAVQRIFEKHPITPEDYRAAVGFLHEVGETGEVPLIMDVFFEALVGGGSIGYSPYERASLVTHTNQADQGFMEHCDRVANTCKPGLIDL